MRRARRAGDLARDAVQTAFRLVPWPTETGLRRVGDAGEGSPVIVTGNYDLTVRRVLRALEGRDAWVVVAPSGGINVWCASSGGHLTTHQVVSALKTSGVERRVSHRRAILPQLAATGVRARDVARRCGWHTRFGPVYAEDLPRYLDARMAKSEAMRRVRFGLPERLEMAAAWAVPAALLLGGAAALLRPAWSPPLAALAVALSLAVFLAYDRIPGPRRILLGVGSALLALTAVALSGGGAAALAAGAASAALLSFVLTVDYAGSTPVEGGSHFEERRYRITLDLERCRGVFTCFEVCPEACFEKPPPAPPGSHAGRKVDLAHDERCIRCGACIVQCPQDALFFEDAAGHRLEPAALRRFKLTLLGRRTVDAGAPPR